MKSQPGSARAKINRANSGLSTGPKSILGKKRASQNALRHGLSIPITVVPRWSADIDDLALRLVEGNKQDVRLEMARAIAAAHFDVLRIRETRKLILSDEFRRLPKWSPRCQVRLSIDILSG